MEITEDDIIEAIGSNDLFKVKELLNKGIDFSIRDNYCIRFASINGHLEVVKLLLKDKRVDPSDINNYAICYSFQNNHLEISKILLNDKRVRSKLPSKYIKNQRVINYLKLKKNRGYKWIK